MFLLRYALLALIGVGVLGVAGTLFTVKDTSVSARQTVTAPQKFGLQQGDMRTFEFAERRFEAPQSTFVTAEGSERTLGDWRGKVILVNLWATWCAPCIEELPALDRLQAAMGSEDFEVVALSVDKAGPQKTEAFLKDLGIEHLALFNDQTMGLMWELQAAGLPTTILFDANGTEIGRLAGIAAWDGQEAKRLIQYFIDQEAGTA
ncbi:MAG: TlpA disulfide reductase family protein [Pseudomonadota bacterium]